MKERSGMPYDVVAYEADEYARLLDPWEEGVFHRMLRLAWMNGSIPADLRQLADLCRVRPSSLRKSWPNLSPLWIEESGRLRNKKQENERLFLESKRNSARESAKLSWKSNKRKKKRSANAKRTQSERIASLPIPSPSHSSTVVEEVMQIPACGQFANVLLSEAEKTRLVEKFGTQGTSERIEALSEGIASKGYRYKSHYATILTWDRKNGTNGNHHGKRLDKGERNAETARRLLSRLDSENRGGGNGGDLGIIPGGLLGKATKPNG
jgi:uncharacterized protein YdaU (DUF1376 family)